MDDLQEAILRGAWKGQRYSKIAEEFHCTEGHVRNVASELWQVLSNVLGEELNKSNFKTTLERCRFSIISSKFAKDCTQINNVNVCGDTLQPPEVPKERSPSTPTSDTSQPQTRLDLADAPHISLLCDSPDGDSFASRTSETRHPRKIYRRRQVQPCSHIRNKRHWQNRTFPPPNTKNSA